MVDVVDDLHVSGQDAVEHRGRPALERLGKHRVVGVGAGPDGDVPRGLPGQAFHVHEDPHELGDGQGRVRVVQLDGDLVGEGGEVGADGVPAPELGRLEAPDDVLEGGSAHEVLLLQAELLAFEEVIVGVQHAGDVLGEVAVQDGLDVVTVVDCGQRQKHRSDYSHAAPFNMY